MAPGIETGSEVDLEASDQFGSHEAGSMTAPLLQR